MLEVSLGRGEDLGGVPPPEPPQERQGARGGDSTLRERAAKLCRDYLRGAWLSITPHDMILKQVSGGLSNLLYYCALPEGVEPKGKEPRSLLLRLYGNMNQERAMETLVTESVIFTLLSESQRGPRLYGVFPGGRLEQYINARPLTTRELGDPTISGLIADKMAQIHLMDVPINKQPNWLWQTMQRWIKQIDDIIESDRIKIEFQSMMHTIEEFNLGAEYEWLKDFLTNVKSPVVFCHNDLQEGNILLKRKAKKQEVLKNKTQMSTNDVLIEEHDTELDSDRLVVIDFEYCAYNYRGFDFANHFCEWVYDYSNTEPPYFFNLESNKPSKEQKEHLITSYLNALTKYPEYKARPQDNLKTLLKEIEAFTLASHFFWGLWSVINSTTSEINFDYWGYGAVRFQAYYKHKMNILADPSLEVEN